MSMFCVIMLIQFSHVAVCLLFLLIMLFTFVYDLLFNSKKFLIIKTREDCRDLILSLRVHGFSYVDESCQLV